MARIVYTDMSGQERSVPIGPDYPVVTIGRATDCTVRSNRKSVSRRHAEFRYSNGQFEVIDLNSSNGTYLIINEERKPVLGREYLANNDEVWCGDFILRFFEEDGPVDQGGDSTLNASDRAGNANRATAPPSFPNGPGAGQSFGGGPSNGANGPGGSNLGGGLGPGGSNLNGPRFGASAQQGQQSQDWPSDSRFGGNEPSSLEESSGPRGGGPSGTPGSGPTGGPAFGAHGGDQAQEIERLRAEKESIAELAERQKAEIDEWQRKYEEARDELENADKDDATSRAASSAGLAATREALERAEQSAEEQKAELNRLQNELAEARTENERFRAELKASSEDDAQIAELQDELQRARQDNEALRAELDASGAADPEEVEQLREQLEGHLLDISALEGEVDRLTTEMREMEEEAAATTRAGERKAREEVDALRREVERHRRLVEEFETRNGELQEELAVAQQSRDNLQNQVGEQDTKLDELESELETLAADLEAARTERDEAVARIEELEGGENVDDLKNEIEGLKRRLKMEKERAGEDDARLSEEIERLTNRVTELESENTGLREQLDAVSEGGGITADTLATLREKIAALDRIVDAITRTNLDPLSTVDRIRLQSAIRDTDPKKTLANLLDMTGGESQSD